VVQEVAERASAATIVLGGFMKAGEAIRINIRVQDASTGKILTAENIEGVGESSIFPMVDELTRRIKNRFELNTAADMELDRAIQDVTTSSTEALRYYVEGLNFHNRGDFEEAILLREKAVDLDPTFAMALARLGTAHNNLGHRKEAEEYARRALEHSDRLPARERYYIEGRYYSLRRGTWNRAIEVYRQALKLDPDDPGSRNNMAVRLYLFEHVDEAIEHFEELRRRRYPFVLTHAQLAICYGLKGQFDRGYQVLAEYLEKHPDNSTGYAALGRYLTFWGRLDEALESFRKAESLDPGNSASHFWRPPLFILLEDWEGAEKYARWMRTSGDPEQETRGLRSLGTVRLHQGRFQEALDLLEQAEVAGEDPTDIARACVSAAAVLLVKGEPSRALEKAQRAQREGENDLPEWQGLFYGALARARMGRWDDVAKSAEELRIQAESLPTDIERRRYRHLMGELALIRGDAAEAIEELHVAESTLLPRWFNSTSQHVPIWYSLASAYLESGDEERAAEWFQRIVESSIERTWWPIPYVRSFYFLGKIHENRGDMEKAREHYRRFYDYWKDGDMDRERIEEVKAKIM
jgi:tetratricopeptide (TPR) repeat protein